MPSTKIRLALGTESNAAARCFSVTFETYIYFILSLIFYISTKSLFYIHELDSFCTMNNLVMQRCHAAILWKYCRFVLQYALRMKNVSRFSMNLYAIVSYESNREIIKSTYRLSAGCIMRLCFYYIIFYCPLNSLQS